MYKNAADVKPLPAETIIEDHWAKKNAEKILAEAAL
jgi:hypothetical protein